MEALHAQAQQAAAEAARHEAANGDPPPNMPPEAFAWFERISERIVTTAVSAATAAMQGQMPQQQGWQAGGKGYGYMPDTKATGKLDSLNKDGCNWSDFSTKLKSHVQAADPDLAEYLEDAELGKAVPDIEDLDSMTKNGARGLQHTLTMLTRGIYLKLVRSTKDHNGILSYAKLAKECDPKTESTELGRLIRILYWDFSDPIKFSAQLISFKEEIQKFEEQMEEGTNLPNIIKVAAICQSCPEALSDYLRLHAAKKPLVEVEKIALDFLRSKGMIGKDPDAMDVDALYKGKGKGKDGKGKGKWQDKGKGKWNDKGKSKGKDGKGKGKYDKGKGRQDNYYWNPRANYSWKHKGVNNLDWQGSSWNEHDWNHNGWHDSGWKERSKDEPEKEKDAGEADYVGGDIYNINYPQFDPSTTPLDTEQGWRSRKRCRD